MKDVTLSTQAWHALDANAVLSRLGTGPEGLSQTEARARLERYGPNALAQEERESLVTLTLRHLASPVIYILLAAVAVSLLTRNFVDAAAIAVVIVLNTVLGVAQEWRAEQALSALKALSAPRARVLRAGQTVWIPAFEVVVGDLLVLEAGDRVAADARVVAAEELQTDESALTGESEPVTKRPDTLPEATELADRANAVWMSTVVTGGRGQAVVFATGMRTTVGGIAAQMRSTHRPQTPLQRRINRLGTVLGIVAVSLGVALFLLGLVRGYPAVEMLLFAVAAAVSSVPAGLPAAVSVTLALGVRRMATQNAIVRRLPAVETLGSTNVICSDKTGTITRNEMTVTRVFAGGEEYPAKNLPDLTATKELLVAGAVANNARVLGEGPEARIEGTATERAILALSHRAGINPAAFGPRLAEIPFSSSRKFMAVLTQDNGKSRVWVKGAPEKILPRCNHYLSPDGMVLAVDEEFHWQVQDAVESFTALALRVVAAAYREEDEPKQFSEENLGADFIFVGLWGMVDPPRPEAGPAVQAAKAAGIRVMMITGDHAATATAIGREVGILEDSHGVITGQELDELKDADLARRLEQVSVCARVTPAHKLKILQALSSQRAVVAMTGDGVNDAPALKAAGIGIAMGRTGTEVAKEAADMVLTDDNFATIVRAIAEGRVIFHNIRRVATYLMATNFGEMLTFTGCILLGLDKPLTPVMVLWVNLVTDGACTIPLGLEPGRGDVLSEPPRSPTERLVSNAMIRRIALLAVTMAAGTLLQFAWDRSRPAGSLAHARTVAFTTLAAFQWFQAFAMRSTRRSVFSLGFAGNRWLLVGILTAVALQVLVIHTPVGPTVFGTVPLSLADWARILTLSGSILAVDEMRKLVSRIRDHYSR